MNTFDGFVLGLESSCDETSASILEGREILSNVVSSQAELHIKWGGVVPEMAARKHAEAVLPTIEEALAIAKKSITDINAIAVTNRPGLVGALSVGVSSAKALAYSLRIPIIGIDHLEGHVLSAALISDIDFPHVCLLVSGGHTEIILVREIGTYRRLGGTIDDAAGEAFDKSARALGLGYPGGPVIQKAGESGDATLYKLPKGLAGDTLDFSFSGLKTAMLYLARDEGDSLDIASAAASFEETITSVLAERTERACVDNSVSAVTLVGGVAANSRLRRKMQEFADRSGINFVTPPFSLCTDNAAMIAFAGSLQLAKGCVDDLDLDVMPRSEMIK